MLFRAFVQTVCECWIFFNIFLFYDSIFPFSFYILYFITTTITPMIYDLIFEWNWIKTTTQAKFCQVHEREREQRYIIKCAFLFLCASNILHMKLNQSINYCQPNTFNLLFILIAKRSSKFIVWRVLMRA